MSIDHSQPDSLSFPGLGLLRPSHRTLGEQVVGFFIYFVIGISVEMLSRWIVPLTFQSEWYLNLIQTPWTLDNWPHTPFWAIFNVSISLAMWTLWRRYSLRVLKLELSVFLSALALQAFWCVSFFLFQQTLLALVALLLLLCTTILSALLFWKKERISGSLFIPPSIWIFYIMGINMAICINNP